MYPSPTFFVETRQRNTTRKTTFECTEELQPLSETSAGVSCCIDVGNRPTSLPCRMTRPIEEPWWGDVRFPDNASGEVLCHRTCGFPTSSQRSVD